MKVYTGGYLELDVVNFENIQSAIDKEGLTLQKAFEKELTSENINIGDINGFQWTMKTPKDYLDLYCRIACSTQLG